MFAQCRPIEICSQVESFDPCSSPVSWRRQDRSDEIKFRSESISGERRGKKKKKRKKEEKNKIEETFTPLGHENPGLIVRVKTELLTRHTFFFFSPHPWRFSLRKEWRVRFLKDNTTIVETDKKDGRNPKTKAKPIENREEDTGRGGGKAKRAMKCSLN